MTPHRLITVITVLLAASWAVLSASPAAAATADRTPPTVPQDVRIVGTNTNSVSLAWTGSTDRSGSVTYRVYVDSAWRGSPTGSTHTQGGLAAGTRYTFVVRAEDRYGNVSSSSNAATGSTAAGAPTGAPSNLRVAGVTYDSVSLAWDPAAGSVAYYQILRNGVWVNSSYGTAAYVRYLAAGTTSTFEVRARDNADNVSASVSVSATTETDDAPPSSPPNLRVVTNAVGTPVGLTWDASTDNRGVATYVLFADDSDAFGGGQDVSFEALTDEFCTVLRGQTYAFTVRAVDLTGNVSAAGTSVTATVP